MMLLLHSSSSLFVVFCCILECFSDVAEECKMSEAFVQAQVMFLLVWNSFMFSETSKK